MLCEAEWYPFDSFKDGVGNAFGYSLILILVSIFRETLGSGSLLGFSIFPENFYSFGYVNNGLMLLAPGAFIMLGIIAWIQKTLTNDLGE